MGVLVATGMRKGELLGLQWADLDLERSEVHVAWAITDAGPGKGVLRKPTKRNDWRDVPLTAGAAAAIRRQHERAFEFHGKAPFPTDYVFPSPLDPAVPHRPDTFGDRWARVSGSSDVTMHQLRHFAATTMLDAGEDYRTAAEILGNSENTLKLHYEGRTHVGKRRAIGALEI